MPIEIKRRAGLSFTGGGSTTLVRDFVQMIGIEAMYTLKVNHKYLCNFVSHCDLIF